MYCKVFHKIYQDFFMVYLIPYKVHFSQENPERNSIKNKPIQIKNKSDYLLFEKTPPPLPPFPENFQLLGGSQKTWIFLSLSQNFQKIHKKSYKSQHLHTFPKSYRKLKAKSRTIVKKIGLEIINFRILTEIFKILTKTFEIMNKICDI